MSPQEQVEQAVSPEMEPRARTRSRTPTKDTSKDTSKDTARKVSLGGRASTGGDRRSSEVPQTLPFPPMARGRST